MTSYIVKPDRQHSQQAFELPLVVYVITTLHLAKTALAKDTLFSNNKPVHIVLVSSS